MASRRQRAPRTALAVTTHCEADNAFRKFRTDAESSGSGCFAKKTLGAGRARDSRKSGPEAPKSPWGDEVGPHGNHRQAAAGSLFRPAERVFRAKWADSQQKSEISER